MYHDQLKKRIKEKGCTLTEIAEEIDIAPSSLTHRIKCEIPWRLTEIYFICDLLDIPYREIYRFFPPSTRNLRSDLMADVDKSSDYKDYVKRIAESLAEILLQPEKSV